MIDSVSARSCKLSCDALMTRRFGAGADGTSICASVIVFVDIESVANVAVLLDAVIVFSLELDRERGRT